MDYIPSEHAVASRARRNGPQLVALCCRCVFHSKTASKLIYDISCGSCHFSEAIVLARECEVPDILPAAFYALSVQKWGCLADGGRSHITLSPADLRRFITAREKLEEIRVDIAVEPFRAGLQRTDYAPCDACREPLLQQWRKIVSASDMSALGCWLLRELWLRIQNGDDLLDRTLCEGCLRLHGEMLWQRYLNLKASIPRIFQLP